MAHNEEIIRTEHPNIRADGGYGTFWTLDNIYWTLRKVFDKSFIDLRA